MGTLQSQEEQDRLSAAKKLLTGLAIFFVFLTAAVLIVPKISSSSNDVTSIIPSSSDNTCFTGTHEEVMKWCNGRCCVKDGSTTKDNNDDDVDTEKDVDACIF